jgi:hypothetical protein
VELLRDRHADEEYVFEADQSETAATADAAEVTARATDWATHFYKDLLHVENCEFRNKPPRFWLISFVRLMTRHHSDNATPRFEALSVVLRSGVGDHRALGTTERPRISIWTPSLSRPELIFRALLNGMQAQDPSHWPTPTLRQLQLHRPDVLLRSTCRTSVRSAETPLPV